MYKIPVERRRGYQFFERGINNLKVAAQQAGAAQEPVPEYPMAMSPSGISGRSQVQHTPLPIPGKAALHLQAEGAEANQHVSPSAEAVLDLLAGHDSRQPGEDRISIYEDQVR